MIKKSFVILYFILLITSLSAQSSYLERGDRGVDFIIDFRMKGAVPESSGISIGYSLNGIMDLGISMGVDLSEQQGESFQNTYLKALFSAMILKQGADIPVLLQLGGKYGLYNTNSSFLETNGLTQSGYGFSIQSLLARDFALGSFFTERLGFSVIYRYSQHTRSNGLTSDDLEFSYGLVSGNRFSFSDKFSLILDIRAAITTELVFKIEPELKTLILF